MNFRPLVGIKPHQHSSTNRKIQKTLSRQELTDMETLLGKDYLSQMLEAAPYKTRLHLDQQPREDPRKPDPPRRLHTDLPLKETRCGHYHLPTLPLHRDNGERFHRGPWGMLLLEMTTKELLYLLHAAKWERPHAPPLERNLEVTDFPPPPKVPITEEVMEELREVTYQYANVADPTESAARCQRVLQSEAKGLMEETATRTVETASNNLRVYEERNMANASDASFTLNTPTLVGNEEVSQTPAAVRRTRSGTTAFRRTQASPRLFTGTNLRIHNIAQSSQ